MQKSSLAVYQFLNEQNLLQNAPRLWWPDAGTFTVVISAVLTQNTTWQNVQRSLQNLENTLTLESFISLHVEELKELIRPSGFYNQKAPRLLTLAKNIQERFGTFEVFQQKVTREWLLAQNGIGEESADAILCYACLRNEMVVDSYTKRLLKKEFGIVFKTYGEYKEYLQSGLKEAFTCKELYTVYARFHGMIVEYNKRHKLEPFK